MYVCVCMYVSPHTSYVSSRLYTHWKKNHYSTLRPSATITHFRKHFFRQYGQTKYRDNSIRLTNKNVFKLLNQWEYLMFFQDFSSSISTLVGLEFHLCAKQSHFGSLGCFTRILACWTKRGRDRHVEHFENVTRHFSKREFFPIVNGRFLRNQAQLDDRSLFFTDLGAFGFQYFASSTGSREGVLSWRGKRSAISVDPRHDIRVFRSKSRIPTAYIQNSPLTFESLCPSPLGQCSQFPILIHVRMCSSHAISLAL